MRRSLLVGLAIATVVSVGLGVPGGARAAEVLEVPLEYATVQAAVAAASAGDTVLVHDGVYAEGVLVTNDDHDRSGITIRGTSRDGAIIDGGNSSCDTPDGTVNDAIKIERVSNVRVENLTVRNFKRNGVFYDGVYGFWVEGVHAHHNCGYGIYAIRSRVGAFRNSEADHHGDSGLYVGEIGNENAISPNGGEAGVCNCVLEGNDVHDNVLGYSGSNADYVLIRNNRWHHNAIGLLPNQFMPFEWGIQENTLIVDNEIYSNNLNPYVAGAEQRCSGATCTFHVPWGTGVGIAGGLFNGIKGNRIWDNVRWGVGIFYFQEPASGNRVEGNVFGVDPGNNRLANGFDIWWDEQGVNNCFQGNGPVTSDPAILPDCGGPVTAGNPVMAVYKDFWLAYEALVQPNTGGGLGGGSGCEYPPCLP